jgi:hypothetical protein
MVALPDSVADKITAALMRTDPFVKKQHLTVQASTLWVIGQNTKHAWIDCDAAAEEEAFGPPQELGVIIPDGLDTLAIKKFHEFIDKLKKK